MFVYLIRHAHAGSRTKGHKDILRPLTPKGHKQAETIADLLDHRPIGTVWSSTATRCVQTVEPLATRLGVKVKEHIAFWEDSSHKEAMSVIQDHLSEHDHDIVISAHGNNIPQIVKILAKKNVPIKGSGCEKGSIWTLEYKGGWISATYNTKKSSPI